MSNTLRVTTDYVAGIFNRTGLRYASPDATTWIRTKLNTLVGNHAGQIIEQEVKHGIGSTVPMIGKMYLFIYDPIGKNELSYYDTFPLIFVLNWDQKSVLGLNLHYLPPATRAKFLDALLSYAINPKLDTNTRLQISYDLISSVAKLKAYLPCIKKYDKKHIRSSFVNIRPEEWKFASFMPLERFQKEKKQDVWNESLKSIQ